MLETDHSELLPEKAWPLLSGVHDFVYFGRLPAFRVDTAVALIAWAGADRYHHGAVQHIGGVEGCQAQHGAVQLLGARL